MNNCSTYEITSCPPVNTTQHEYAKNLPPSLFNNESKQVNKSELQPQLLENHRKVNHRCLHSFGPPPRPFKKARYGWEIKNYDYTLKKMCQNIKSSAQAMTQENQDPNPEEKAADINLPQRYAEGSNFCVGVEEVCNPPKVLKEGKTPEMHMIGPPHQGGFVGPLMPTSYHAHYGAVMGTNLPHGTPLSPRECLNSFHAQIPPDPDARLIRWHTRQLCRSIFDNTVNRMLENMGFSPVTERSQALHPLHPLLVLSLSDDEEREAEEAHQRSLETQALSAALHQKGLLPSPYHYDPLESATTSDYDSSEEDSELGEGGPDDLASEQPQQQCSLLSHPPSQGSEEAYLTLNHTQHPSLAHLIDKPLPYLSHPTPLALLSQNTTESCEYHCSPTQNLCDYQNDCDVRGIPAVTPSLFSGQCEEQIKNFPIKGEGGEVEPNIPDLSKTSNLKESFHEERENQSLDCNRSEGVCQGLSPSDPENGTSFNMSLKVDNNENCLTTPTSPQQETTLIEGTVEKRALNDHHTSPKMHLESDVAKGCENDNNNDSYFIRNAIHMAIKQQGLGFQRA